MIGTRAAFLTEKNATATPAGRLPAQAIHLARTLSEKNRPLRLLMVTPSYLPNMGGVENHVNEVARRLVKISVDVTILTSNLDGKLPAREQIAGVTIQRVPSWLVRSGFYIAPGIYSAMLQGDWDIVHVQSYHTLVAPLAMVSALRAKLPYVVTFHGGGHSSQWRNRIRKQQLTVLRPLLARAERLVAVAKFEIDLYGSLLRIPQERFVYCPNGCDLPSTPKTTSKTTSRTDSQTASTSAPGMLIASIGRLERYKGHHRILAALPHILTKQPDARLWIAGAGPYESELRQLAEKLGLSDRVDIRAIPPTERGRMAQELSKVSLVTLLSEFETHPVAALEALGMGRPLLVTDTSGLRELAEQGLARSAPLESTPEQIANAVIEQLRNPLLPPKSLNLPTWDDCANGLLSIYQNCLTDRIV
jgi:glycosyltransferase involved in cell wall biosynthesis